MGPERSDRRSRSLLRPLPRIPIRRLSALASSRRAWAACVAGIGCLAFAVPAAAENWRITSSASVTETYTSNVNYTSIGNPVGDFVTTLNGAIAINGAGSRVRLNGSIGASALIYAKETQYNSFAPNVVLAGSVEAVENFFFVDASANISQTFYSPFGPQPGNLVNATINRYTAQTYSLSPYIRGRIPGTNLSYLVRDDNIWTLSSQFGDASVQAPNTYFNSFNGRIESPVAPWGWTVEAVRNYYAPTNQDTFGTYTNELARGLLQYQIDPQLQVALRGGYEHEKFPLTSSDGVIYGAGLTWAPSDRTQLNGYWEHRFFGSSYSVQFSHRLPRIALAASFARGLNTYPQNALTIPAGANVPAFVDAAFATRIQDPAERALAVQQFLAQSGLPPTLATPVNIFAPSIQLQTIGSVSAVLIGVRSSLALSVYYTKSDAIAGTGAVLPPALQFGQANTQTGGGVSFSHRLTSVSSLTASATYASTKSNLDSGVFANADSKNAYVNVGLATVLAPRTTGTVGGGYNRFSPNGGSILDSASAWSLYAGLNHTF